MPTRSGAGRKRSRTHDRLPAVVLDTARMIIRDDDFGLEFGSFGTGRDIPITFRFRRGADAMACLALSNRSVVFGADGVGFRAASRRARWFFQASRRSETDNAVTLVNAAPTRPAAPSALTPLPARPTATVSSLTLHCDALTAQWNRALLQRSRTRMHVRARRCPFGVCIEAGAFAR